MSTTYYLHYIHRASVSAMQLISSSSVVVVLDVFRLFDRLTYFPTTQHSKSLDSAVFVEICVNYFNQSVIR